MGRRHQVLTPADLGRLAAVGDCVTVLEADRGWARAAQDRWGLCGVLDGTLDSPKAMLLIAPAWALPSCHPLSGRSRTPDAAGLMALHVGAGGAGGADETRMARQLVQAVAAKLVTRASCLEAVAGADGGCATPSEAVLSAAGFRRVVDEQHPTDLLAPRWRLELSATVWARATDVVRKLVDRSWAPMPPPEPSHRVSVTERR